MAVDLETVKPSFAKATTTSATTSRSAILPSPPPRAPKNPVQMQSVSNMLPPMLSQAVHIPPMPRVPASNSNNNKENKDASIPASPKASNASSSKTKSPPSGWIQTTRPPPALPAKVMQAPFTKKLSSGKPGSSGSKGQTSLNGFVVKADLSTASDAESSFASTSSSSGIGKKRSAERAEPWGEEAMKPQKAARTEKGKGKGPGIGSLNVKQQIVLSAEQQKVLKMVVDEKKNVFFTGSAGEIIFVLSLPGFADVLLCVTRYWKVDPSTRDHRFSSTKVCSQGCRPGLHHCLYRYGSCQHWWYDDPFLCGHRSRPRHRRTTRRFRS